MATRKINECVNFALCLFLLVNFGASEQTQNTNTNENPDPSSTASPSEDSDFSFLRQYLTVFQKSVEQLEKFHEEFKELKAAYKKVDELSEQVKWLKEKMDGISEDSGVWLLTPPLRGPPGPKGEKGDSAMSEPKENSDSTISDAQQNVTVESCVPKENWVTVHELNNTSPSDVKTVVKATVGFRLQQNLQNSTDSGNSVDSTGISHAFFQAEIFARMEKSNSTGFDWSSTPFFIWTRETAITETYTCKAQSSCVLKQLVGQCGNARVPVDKFSQVSTPIVTSIPDSKFTSCRDAMETLPSSRSTKQRIYPHGNGTSLEVLCDFETDGGGWTIIQKRTSGPKEQFKKNWTEYKNGFGSLDENFWLGLENIRALTKNGDQELRIELEDFEGEKRWAKYSNFSISDASDFYRLTIGRFSGDSTAGDSMTGSRSLNGHQFTTIDKDNDNNSGYNCALEYRGGGGWWFNDCSTSNLNGLYYEKGEYVSGYQGILWGSWKQSYDYSMAKSEMKIRTKKP